MFIFTAQRWWSFSSSHRTCLSCRWKWTCTRLWKRCTNVIPRMPCCAGMFPQPPFFYVSASAVDVSAAQHSVGRPDQAAPGWCRCLAVQTQNRSPELGYLLFPLGVFVFVLLKRLCPTDLCEKEPFLDTEDGLPFRSVFKHVRLQYIINDLASARILERDNILPPGENESDETFLGDVVAMLHLLVFIFNILFQIGWLRCTKVSGLLCSGQSLTMTMGENNGWNVWGKHGDLMNRFKFRGPFCHSLVPTRQTKMSLSGAAWDVAGNWPKMETWAWRFMFYSSLCTAWRSFIYLKSLSSQYCWRWTGFNFGFDLLVTYTNRFIVFKRNTLSQPCGGAVSLQPRRHLAYRSVLRSTSPY